jgi:hypothetical protein
VRLSIRDARRQIPVAEHHRAARQLALELRLPLIAVGHVEQLHHVRAVLPIAAQRTLDLAANRRVVRRERQQAHQPAGVDQAVAQPFGLRLLPALVEALEGNQNSFRHQSSNFKLESAK